jgi:GAF domain-containing protein
MREQGVLQPADLRTIPEESDREATIHRLKAELRQKDEEQLAISQVHRAIAAHLENDELFAAIAASASVVLRFSCMGVVLPGVDEQDLLVYFVDRKQGQATCLPARVFPAGGTVSAWVFENQESFLAQHIEDLRPFPYCYKDCRKAGIQSHCALPLVIRDRTVGVLIFAGREKNLYPTSLLPFLRQFAAAVAIAIDNRLAHEGRARLKSQLALSNVGHIGVAATKTRLGVLSDKAPRSKR